MRTQDVANASAILLLAAAPAAASVIGAQVIFDGGDHDAQFYPDANIAGTPEDGSVEA